MTWANDVDPDQTPQKAASDLGLDRLPPNQQLVDTSQGNNMNFFEVQEECGRY